jgi:uncharacterized protein YbaR (Trm112 family)
MIDKKLLDILACPSCKQPLFLEKKEDNVEVLVCRFDKLVFPIDNGIPVLVLDAALPLG